MEWGRQEWVYIYCQQNFDYIDTMNPKHFGTLYLYFGNTTIEFGKSAMPRTFSVFGDVDIVYDVRDFGEYAEPSFETEDSVDIDNNAVTRFECTLTNQEGRNISIETFDFREIELTGFDVFDIYFDQYQGPSIYPQDVYFHKFCILTNVKRQNGKLETNFNYSWNTAEKDADGNSLYPNGKYVMEIRAYDYEGNFCRRKDTLIIKNNGI